MHRSSLVGAFCQIDGQNVQNNKTMEYPESTTVSTFTFSNITEFHKDCTSYKGDDIVGYYYSTRHHIEAYFLPIVYGIGFPGNILSLILWLQPRLRNSSGIYFATLSLSDTIVLLLHMILSLQSFYDLEILYTNALCITFSVFYMTSECFSVLLVLGLTIDRYIVICHPMKRLTFCTVNRTIKVICFLYTIAFIIGLIEGTFWIHDSVAHRCAYRTLFRTSDAHSVIEIGNIIILIIGVLIPSLLVLIFNVMIIVALREFQRKRETMTVGRVGSPDIEATIMLLCVSCYVILSEIPDTVFFLILPFYPRGDATVNMAGRAGDPLWARYYRFGLTSSIIGAFSLTNYAINILIFSLIGRKFRKTCLFVFMRCLKREMSSHSDFEHSLVRGQFREKNSKVNSVLEAENKV